MKILAIVLIAVSLANIFLLIENRKIKKERKELKERLSSISEGIKKLREAFPKNCEK